MFNRCRRWRALLTRRADGRLTLQELGALEDHLALCPCCRAAEEADRALRDVYNLHITVLNESSARAFDDRVVAALEASPARLGWLRLARFCRQWQARCKALPFAFFGQIAGSALVAAAVTTVCLLSALHPAGSSTPSRPVPADRSALSAAARNVPPMPLEALWQNQSPRAALLWTPQWTPHVPAPALASPPPAPASPAPRVKATAHPDRHSDILPVDPMG